MARLDDLLAKSQGSDASLDAMRAALQAELKRPPARSWRKGLALTVGASWALMLAFGVALVASGSASPAQLASRGALIAGLAALTALLGGLALAPLGRLAPAAGVLAGVAGAAGLVLARGAGLEGTAPEWLCTVTHLGAGALPLGLMIAALRRAAPNPWRALAGGFAVGTTGAVIGELACGRGWQHVLVYHLSAWALVAAASLLVSRRVKPLSYAP